MSDQEARRPTINDVARRAGVSKSLVSLVMRGAPQVSDARREAVLDAARQLGYRPNTVARSLVEGHTRTIGVVVSDLRNPWYVDILDGLRRTLKANGLRVLIGGGQLDHKVDPGVAEAFLDLRVEGLCVIGTLPYDEALAEAMKTVPSVVTSSHSYELPYVDSVVNDDEQGTRIATEYLLNLGHKRIAHIGGGTDGVAEARRRGYEGAMRAHGLAHFIQVEPCDYDETSGYAAASALLRGQNQPTAIIALNDLAGVGALSAADDAGLAVPADLSIIGYDNTPLAAVSHLSLSSVDPSSVEIGELAAIRLQARLRGDAGSAPETGSRDLIRPALVVRKSTAAPRADKEVP
ncbi:LacI family DNA-binding transcriptional regulator [Amycolatopsis echigonensis]|uniref:LacI family DNA-binding transcriptional regulator n=1 Tax=Amycolatopsis echigonensis TaxID=2576905 RepID=A0A8E1W5W9_9PSEU|nr:LacI family DNA-binding transcriptional regulator [Amycolatopsis echigonensis]MBB2504894.1 LacI family DNA-binding transcriptional regulator [Amycolatopsis echigonensis]